ncbi:uncharacterized protein Z518_04370 [Rhinocladiella mackenziei CBS 650.93]|uniref:Uncharacterized protein n=1 Tax=Rhinocladiella mackenziei CBS 650.93 TaxID=1442369 RepID=A0A0D2IL16_9EURO|nr:uncharacterized protein Z518_04370 [Rhinocladiella mackenziei CBS 650.93]KIX06394.1 hypothetical protein Z518_04370 [Rhinocladiella mackenziei CBS 650.93]
MSSNGTGLDGVDGRVTHINCVYPISGTYGLLPRLLYYVTLIFAIFGRTREWLIIGALVSALTYAGTSAIHLMALVTSRADVYDLDIMAAWAILSTGALAYIGIIHWSSTLRNSRARIVMICWGFLVGVSLIFGRAILFDTPLSEPEPACYSSTGILLQYPIELANPQFNCTYKCFSLTKPMRYHSEIMAVPRHLLENRYSGLAYVLVGPIQFAAYAAVSLDTIEHSPSQMCLRGVMAHLIHPRYREDMTKAVYKASMESWYGGYFVLIGYFKRAQWTYKKFLVLALGVPWMFLSLLIDILCLPLMVVNIVLNEITLLSGNLPVNEPDVAIGQWGPIVNSLLVVIATCINKALEIYERRKSAKALKETVEEVITVSPDVERGVMKDEQEIGVVKPKLAHVQTLQDVDDIMTRPK